MGPLFRVPRMVSSVAFRPSSILLFRNPKPFLSLCLTRSPRLRTPKENRYGVQTSSRPDKGNNGDARGKSGNVKRHPTSELLKNLKVGGRFPWTAWLVYGYTFLACLDYFGLIDLAPLIETRVSYTSPESTGGKIIAALANMLTHHKLPQEPEEPEDPKYDEDETEDE